MFNNNGKQSKEEYILSLRSKKPDTEIRKEIGKLFKIGKSQRNKKFNQIFAVQPEWLMDTSTYIKDGKKIKAAHFKANGDKGVAETDSPNIRTLEDLVRVCNIDLEEWQCKRFTGNSYGDNFQAKGEFERRIDKKSVEEMLNNFLESAKDHAPKKFNIVPRKVVGDHVYVLNLQDLHVGKLAFAVETGWSNYDIKIAKQVYNDAVADLMSKVDHNKIEKIMIIVGSDLIHFDSEAGETTKRTKLDSNDSRWSKVYNEACSLITETIETLASKFQVDVLVVTGNHAKLTEYCLGSYVKAFFRNHSNVLVNNEPLPRKYYSYGKNLILCTHGDDIKLNELPLTMFREKQSEISSFKHLYVLTGHLHTDKVIENHGVKIFVSPALCPPDSWHSNKTFVGNVQTSQGMLYSKEDGLAGIFYSKPV